MRAFNRYVAWLYCFNRNMLSDEVLRALQDCECDYDDAGLAALKIDVALCFMS
ncbi:hypothetical protein JG687_00013813 [Phytophthora cactorum]|uniref:Uncharacterized protein n=1 Tax=Phytophthora cactorum TaxID=29920 RepID=A0A8T1U381_9STRA|nr:hypothetical protein JG687_00013813 [Phytophthora cactorum]